jgi:hypothetical protein
MKKAADRMDFCWQNSKIELLMKICIDWLIGFILTDFLIWYL